jgi:putative oxidoreductase
MAYAYWTVHAPTSTFAILNHGESAILFCFIWLLVAAAGPGPWSIDAARGRKLVQTEDAGEPVP